MSIQLNDKQLERLSAAILWQLGLSELGEDIVGMVNEVAGDHLFNAPIQEDGLSVDTGCKDYDLLERLHKQEPVSKDQQFHYEAGWEAAVRHLTRQC